MSKQAYASYSSEDQHDNLLAQRKGFNVVDGSVKNAGKKTIMQRVLEKLDKILIVLAIVLLVVFYLHSQHRSRQIYKKVVNKEEETTMAQGEKDLTQLDKDKLEDLLEIYKAKMKLQSKSLQGSKGKGQVQRSANQPQEVEQIEAKIGQKYVENEKYAKHQTRNELFNEKGKQNRFQPLKLARFNLENPKDDKQLKTLLFNQEKRKLQKKHGIIQQFDELSMCVVVYARMLKKDYAHQYVLQSIFNQDYKEYSIIFIADGHSFNQVETIKQYIKQKDRNNRITLVWNSQRKNFLESTVNAVKDLCLKKSITVLIDGNDELLGGQVFRLLNVFYRRQSYNMLYGNFIEYYESHQQFNRGFSSQYEQEQKYANSYRLVPQKFGSIKSFKTRLLFFIKQSDFKDSYGNYYKQAGDYALMYPLLELSCGKVGYLPQYNYLYYGEEVDPVTKKEQASNGIAIKAKEQYQCFTAYK